MARSRVDRKFCLDALKYYCDTFHIDLPTLWWCVEENKNDPSKLK